MNEQWKAVPGYPYEVSSHGRIRRTGAAPGARVGRQLKTAPSPLGYVRVDLWRGGRRRPAHVHELVAELFIGPKPAGHVVHHKDGNPLNNHVDNLRYISRRDHVREHHVGEQHPNAKLTDDEVRDIREQLSRGVRQADLARRYGVASCTIKDISKGRTWFLVR